MASDLQAELGERLRAIDAKGLTRELVPHAPESCDFTSNDYLSLSRHAQVIEAARRATLEHGAGAGASRLLGGGCAHDARAEDLMAQWLGAQAALLFATGFQANLGLLTALVQPGDVLLSDSLNHASLIDAARLTKARCVIYAHEDLLDLEQQLARASGARRRWIVTEGIFSMDGDVANLGAIAELCGRYDAWLVVDEAHSVGVIGPDGAGAWAAAREAGASEQRLAARIVPCGKALGAQGGFVVGSVELRKLLVSTARSFVFSTGVAPAISGALTAAIPLARSASVERNHLRHLAAEFASALDMSTPPSPIIPVVIGNNDLAVELAKSVQEAGFEVRAVRPPTVPAGTARIRVVVHAHNTIEEAQQLAKLLAPHVAAPGKPCTHTRPALVVVGTDTDIGKTIVSALLVRAAARICEVEYWKPVQTGDDSDTETVRALAIGTAAAFSEPCYAFPLPASPHEAAAEAEATIYPQVVEDAWREHERSARGALIVELAGGLFVPYDDHVMQADLLARLRPRLVLVARAGLGTLNHTLLTLEALRTRKLRPEALVLVGDEHPSNRETLRRMGGVSQIFEVPLFEELTPQTLDAWLDANELSTLFKP